MNELTPSQLRCLVRGVPASFADGLRQDPAGLRPDVGLARRQHADYVAALRRAGAEIVAVPSDDALADCCFVEDTAVICGGVALIARPGAPQRRREVPPVRRELSRLGLSVCELPDGATLDGGDVLRVGDHLFVGISSRTAAGSVAALASAFPWMRVTAVTVEAGLHLKTAITGVRPDRLVAAAGDAVTRMLGTLSSALPGAEVVRAPPGEDASCLAVGDRVLVPGSSPRLAQALIGRGEQVETVDITEFQKADGGLTCLSLRLP